jgi:hypothetical protein
MLQHDLNDARALIEQAGTQAEGRKYRKAAEIILLKVLNQDPGNAEATSLLQHLRGEPSQTLGTAPQQDVPFTAVPLTYNKEQKRSRKKIPLLVIGLIILGALAFKLKLRSADPNPMAASITQAAPAQPEFKPRVVESQLSVPSPIKKLDANVPTTGTPASLPRVETAPIDVIAPSDMGKLAVSSPTAADIYMRGQYLGSTPTTLQLPAGRQTLEYRHGNLRTVLTSQVKANETTAVSVTFPVTVQINAKPWAQVFLDDGAKRPLGQTPLSGVTVPIGSILAFENPNFASKSYRITESDTAIQVNFP